MRRFLGGQTKEEKNAEAKYQHVQKMFTHNPSAAMNDNIKSSFNNLSNDQQKRLLIETIKDPLTQQTLTSPDHSQAETSTNNPEGLYQFYANKIQKNNPPQDPTEWATWPSYFQAAMLNSLNEKPEIYETLIKHAHPETLNYISTNDMPESLKQYIDQAKKEVKISNPIARARYDTFIRTAKAIRHSEQTNRESKQNDTFRDSIVQGKNTQERAYNTLLEQFNDLSYNEQIIALQSHYITESQKAQLFNQAKPQAQKSYIESLTYTEKNAFTEQLFQEIEQEKLPKEMMIIRGLLLAGLITGITLSFVFPPAGIGILGIGIISVLAFKVSDIITYAVGAFLEKNAVRKSKLYENMFNKIKDLAIMTAFGIGLFFAGPAVISVLIPIAIGYMALSTLGSGLTLLSKMIASRQKNISEEQRPRIYQMMNRSEKICRALGFSLSHPIEVIVSKLVGLFSKKGNQESMIKADHIKSNFLKALSDGLFALFRPVTELMEYGHETFKYFSQQNKKQHITEMIKQQANEQLNVLNGSPRDPPSNRSEKNATDIQKLQEIISECEKKPSLNQLKTYITTINEVSPQSLISPVNTALIEQNGTLVSHVSRGQENFLQEKAGEGGENQRKSLQQKRKISAESSEEQQNDVGNTSGNALNK